MLSALSATSFISLEQHAQKLDFGYAHTSSHPLLAGWYRAIVVVAVVVAGRFAIDANEIVYRNYIDIIS